MNEEPDLSSSLHYILVHVVLLLKVAQVFKMNRRKRLHKFGNVRYLNEFSSFFFFASVPPSIFVCSLSILFSLRSPSLFPCTTPVSGVLDSCSDQQAPVFLGSMPTVQPSLRYSSPQFTSVGPTSSIFTLQDQSSLPL